MSTAIGSRGISKVNLDQLESGIIYLNAKIVDMSRALALPNLP